VVLDQQAGHEPTLFERLHHSPARRRRSPTKPGVILYFSGDADCRIAFSRIARRWQGIDLVVTSDRARCRRIALTVKPRLILADDHLPDCDAHALVVELQRSARTARIPVVVLSSDDATQARFTRAGAAAWLTKPLNIAEVERTTLALLELAPAH
jgi:PleD family two-component response regulator